ncbi:MAG: hypothetical protein HY812_22470 [Planctomycetes bacterium]|nr:hypothetical protein [Planctomycetota bacterium]
MTAVAVPRRGKGPPRILGAVEAEESEDPASVAHADRLAAAALRLAGKAGARGVVLGLPVSWTEHRVIETPAVRGIDATAVVLREVVKLTQLPKDDLLFAESVEVIAPTDAQERRGRTALRLVSAVRESLVLGLVQRLAVHGVRVISVCSAPAALLVRLMRQPGRARQAARSTGAAAFLLLRRDGFALALCEGARLHQFRLVGVTLPPEPENLGSALAEEVRRSAVFFRETQKGRELQSLTVLGRYAGDHDLLARLVRESTGIETIVDEACSEDADALLEAGAAADLHDARGKGDQELLPREVSRRRSSNLTAALCGLLILGVIGASGLVARGLASVAGHSRARLFELGGMQPALDTMETHFEILTLRAETFLERKTQLGALLDSRLDQGRLLLGISLAVPPEVHLREVKITSDLGAELAVEIDGCVASSQWEFEPYVARFQEALLKEIGLHSATSEGSRETRNEGLPPFRLTCSFEATNDEPPGP